MCMFVITTIAIVISIVITIIIIIITVNNYVDYYCYCHSVGVSAIIIICFVIN